MKATLLLEDGTVFHGTAFGACGEICGEVVFNTSMSGYEEVLTDPSYHEQMVVMTYPLIGNYGTNRQDRESKTVRVNAFIVRENCVRPSNFRSEESLSDYLKRNNIIGVEGIDTRRLVRHIRIQGAMNGILSTSDHSRNRLAQKLSQFPGLPGRDIVKAVSSRKPYTWTRPVMDMPGINAGPGSDKRHRVIAVDYGIKHNILRLLVSYGCDVRVVPAKTDAKTILKQKPDGVFLSNGPGDPAPVTYAAETVRGLLGKVPVFGICLGHQILALALGGQTYKLKFGHHGANHPVKNLKTRRIEITSQNHGFCVDMNSLKRKGVRVTHINLNDQTVEGIRCTRYPAFSVQYHPESSPGPHDSQYLFSDFVRLMKPAR